MEEKNVKNYSHLKNIDTSTVVHTPRYMILKLGAIRAILVVTLKTTLLHHLWEYACFS